MAGVLLPGFFGLLTSFSLYAQSPYDLRCNYAANPLGVETPQPQLSWKLRSLQRQAAYQIQVSSDPGFSGILWDSDKVPSAQPVGVPYAGPSLKSRQRCYWRVRIWDEQNRPTSFSEPQYWEMGLLQQEDWEAGWTGAWAPPAASRIFPGDWISAEGDSAFTFTHSFRLPDTVGIGIATLRFACQDSFSLSVNGIRRAQGPGMAHFQNYYARYWFAPGENSLEVQVPANTPFWLFLSFWLDDGREIVVLSGSGWQISPTTSIQSVPYPTSPLPAAYTPPRALLMRKSFLCPQKPVQARLYLSGLGSYVPFLNGRRIGDQLLAPGWTDYPQVVQYQTFDVTDLLEKGENVLAAHLGNAWWSSGLGSDGTVRYADGPLRLRAQLELTFPDGATSRILTDSSWRAFPSPLLENTLYHGEYYDARLEPKGWKNNGFDDSEWLHTASAPWPAKMRSEAGPPIRITETLRPLRIRETGSDTFVVDFGENIAGRVHLRVQGDAGKQVRLRFAETLYPDGRLYTHNLRSARATDTYVLRGEGKEQWAPDFTYHGFRYVEVSGLDKRPRRNMLQAEVFHSDVQPAGSFTCSNELLNQIHRNARRSLRGNLHSVPTDCPQRDERLGWMGDAQAFAPSACYDFDMLDFFRKWMRDIALGQDSSGYVRDVNPPILLKNEPARPGWGDAVVIIPWTLYRFYGDTALLRENYPAMKAWVEYLNHKAGDSLYVWTNERGTSFGFGDWMATEETDKKLIAAAYQGYSNRLLSKMAAVLEKPEDAAHYGQTFRQIATRFQQRFFRPDSMCYAGGTQTAQLLPLAFGMVPDSLREAVTSALADNIRRQENHLSTGFLGTSWLLPVLSEGGYRDLAYAVATQRSHPSWGYMVEQGATSMWERWNADREGPHTNSRNHFALGPIAEWLYGSLAGIQPLPDAPGFRRFRIAPQPPKGLTWVKASLQTPYGEIAVRWKQTRKRFSIQVEVPPNTEAELRMPVHNFTNPVIKGGKGEMGSGYFFTLLPPGRHRLRSVSRLAFRVSG